MNNTTKDFQVSVLGIDLAKNSFQLHGANTAGQVLTKKNTYTTEIERVYGEFITLLNWHGSL